MKKPEPIKATYYPPEKVFGIPKRAKMLFDKPPSKQQVEFIKDYLDGNRFMSRMPGPRKPKEVDHETP
jgi:hypothetical protein